MQCIDTLLFTTYFTVRYCTIIYLCNQCPSPLKLWQGVPDTTLCNKVCQCLAAGWWFSPSTVISSTGKTDRHDITEILLKVALNTITHNCYQNKTKYYKPIRINSSIHKHENMTGFPRYTLCYRVMWYGRIQKIWLK